MGFLPLDLELEPPALLEAPPANASPAALGDMEDAGVLPPPDA